MALALSFTGTAQGNALVHGDVATDDGGFANDHSSGVIDE